MSCHCLGFYHVSKGFILPRMVISSLCQSLEFWVTGFSSDVRGFHFFYDLENVD